MKNWKEIGQSEDSFGCECEILCDSSFGDVSDGECDCSNCLDIQLEAYNQYQLQQEHISHNQPRRKTTTRITHTKTDKQKERATSKPTKTKDHKSTKVKWARENSHSECSSMENYQQMDNEQDLNYFLIMTRNRTRKFLEERKKLDDEEKQKKEQLKGKISKNLQILKITAKMIQQNNDLKVEDEKNKSYSLLHQYKWNHSQYPVQWKNLGEHNKECCRSIKIKPQLDTGLGEKREHLIEIQKQKQLSEALNRKPGCPYDQCPNHHNRTDPKKINKIKQLIHQKARQYQQQKNQEKKERQKQNKSKAAKLRAIDLKSKQIVSNCKKYDDNVSRTSFKLSIDHFDTFSELRKENEERKQERKQNRKIRKQMKENKQQLRIEEEQEEQEHEFRNPKKTKFDGRKQDFVRQTGKKWNEKIVHDAKISSPRQMKKYQEKQPPKKKTMALNEKKEEIQRKKVEEELSRKKKQLMKQYEKRNTNKTSAYNKQIRENYEEKLKKKKQAVQPYNDPYVQQNIHAKHQKSKQAQYKI